MQKLNDCYAYFAVKSKTLDVAAITARLGIEPTESWAAGDLTPTQRERQFGLWALYSRRPRTDEPEEHVDDVLLQMDANPEAFLAVSREHGGLMQMVGEFHEIGLGLHFSDSVIQRLAYYHLSVDFDAYYLYSDAREHTES